ncbi:MAG: hypothetical protein VX901_11685, partial [Candidatus Poribacteria bacterium]|nr:hypothetical protein [Candidatus Poribacteria bacterium]
CLLIMHLNLMILVIHKEYLYQVAFSEEQCVGTCADYTSCGNRRILVGALFNYGKHLFLSRHLIQ